MLPTVLLEGIQYPLVLKKFCESQINKRVNKAEIVSHTETRRNLGIKWCSIWGSVDRDVKSCLNEKF